MTPLVLNAELGVEGLHPLDHHNNNVYCDAGAPDLLIFLSIHLFDFVFIFHLIIIYSCAA